MWFRSIAWVELSLVLNAISQSSSGGVNFPLCTVAGLCFISMFCPECWTQIDVVQPEPVTIEWNFLYRIRQGIIFISLTNYNCLTFNFGHVLWRWWCPGQDPSDLYVLRIQKHTHGVSEAAAASDTHSASPVGDSTLPWIKHRSQAPTSARTSRDRHKLASCRHNDKTR